MALLTNTAEAGVAAGTTVDATTPGGPDPFTVFGGTAKTYVSTAQKGSLGLQVTAASTYFGWTGVTGGSTAGTAARIYHRVTAAPTTNDVPILNFRSSSGGTGLFSILHTSANKLSVVSDTGGSVGVTTGTLTLNQWNRIEVGFSNASSTTGVLTLRVCVGDSTTPITNLSLDLTALDLGASSPAHCRIGRPTSTVSTYTATFDDVAFRTGSSTLIGPSVSNVAPTANAGTDQTAVEPWATVTLSGTDSDSDGTVASRLWAKTTGSAVTLTNAATATATFTAPPSIAGETMTFSYTVTDNGGLTGTDSVNVTVLPVTERAAIGGVEVPMRVVDA